MSPNMVLFEMVREGKLTAEEAAEIMMFEDDLRRPMIVKFFRWVSWFF